MDELIKAGWVQVKPGYYKDPVTQKLYFAPTAITVYQKRLAGQQKAK